MTLVRPISEVTFELRAAWGSRKRIALSLDERCTPRRLEGKISRVSTTGAFIEIEGFHVPTDAVLAVHKPSRLGDSTIDVPKAAPRCIVCGRVAELGWTDACENCAAALGVAA